MKTLFRPGDVIYTEKTWSCPTQHAVVLHRLKEDDWLCTYVVCNKLGVTSVLLYTVDSSWKIL